jgi:DNA polymerase III alpha subunit (gram-positive type)
MKNPESFLNKHFTRHGLPVLANSVLDTLVLARQYLILPSYSLESVARYLKVDQPQAHRAMADVETTRQVFLKLVERALKVGR